MSAIHIPRFPQPIIDALAVALLHSVWQGLAVATALATALASMRGSSARGRYAVSCLAMLAIIAAPTFVFVSHLTKHSGSGSITSDLPNDATARPGSPGSASRIEIPAAKESFSDFVRPVSERKAILDAADGRLHSPDAGQFGLHPIYKWVVGAWAAGVIAFSFLLLLNWGATLRLRRRAMPAGEKLAATVAGLAQLIRLRRRIRLGLSDRIAVPCLIGWLRPMVLIPFSALTDLPVHQLEAILLHELAHIRRHDYLVNLLQSMTEILLFYHPAVWWVSRQIRRERENCCDDIAADAAGGPMSYSRALLAMEELRIAAAPHLALAVNGEALLPRIHRLLGGPRAPVSRQWPVGAIVLSVLIIAIVLSPFGRKRARADEPVVDAAALVREARAIDAWTIEVQSLRVTVHNKWLATPEQIETRKADLKKKFPETEATSAQYPELLPETSSDQDIAFDRQRIYKREESKNQSRLLDVRYWNGHEGIAYTKHRSGQQNYGFFKEPYRSIGRFLDLQRPNSYCHGLWWVPDDVRKAESDIYGAPESYHLIGRTKFHERDCYVLESDAAPISLYVGLSDHRPYGREERVYPDTVREKRVAIELQIAEQFGHGVRNEIEYGSWLASLAEDRKREIEQEERRQSKGLLVPYFTFWFEDYREVAPGRWFPMHQGYCIYAMLPDEPRRVTGTREIYFDQVLLDKPLPDDLFKMEMKEGVSVTDDRYDPFLTYKYKKHFEPAKWNEILTAADERAKLMQRINGDMDTVVGKPAPDFGKLTWVNSKPLTLNDLKGKVVLVDFWATWCAPCRNDFPGLVDLDKERAKSGIVIVGVHAAGAAQDEVAKVIKEFGMEYPVCMDADDVDSLQFGRLFHAYHVGAIPQSFAIDRDGKISAHGSFAEMAAVARELAARASELHK